MSATLPLPFTFPFPFYGRDIVAIEFNSNGNIELLEAREECVECDDRGGDPPGRTRVEGRGSRWTASGRGRKLPGPVPESSAIENEVVIAESTAAPDDERSADRCSTW